MTTIATTTVTKTDHVDGDENEECDDDDDARYYLRLPPELRNVTYSSSSSSSSSSRSFYPRGADPSFCAAWIKYAPYRLSSMSSSEPCVSSSFSSTTSSVGLAPALPLVPEGTPPIFSIPSSDDDDDDDDADADSDADSASPSKTRAKTVRNEQQQEQQQQQRKNRQIYHPSTTCTSSTPYLCFQVHATSGRARASTIHLPHGSVPGPIFMPVGTKGTIKACATAELVGPGDTSQKSCVGGGEGGGGGGSPSLSSPSTSSSSHTLDIPIILANTYHLALQPGTELLGDDGNEDDGLHSFMNWDRPILTDSGGFQMVSLLKLAEINEDGVTFESPYDECDNEDVDDDGGGDEYEKDCGEEVEGTRNDRDGDNVGDGQVDDGIDNDTVGVEVHVNGQGTKSNVKRKRARNGVGGPASKKTRKGGTKWRPLLGPHSGSSLSLSSSSSLHGDPNAEYEGGDDGNDGVETAALNQKNNDDYEMEGSTEPSECVSNVNQQHPHCQKKETTNKKRGRSKRKRRRLLLRPEDSIVHQMNIGSDIIMALDDVVSSVHVDVTNRFEIATYRTLRWYDRCRAQLLSGRRTTVSGEKEMENKKDKEAKAKEEDGGGGASDAEKKRIGGDGGENKVEVKVVAGSDSTATDAAAAAPTTITSSSSRRTEERKRRKFGQNLFPIVQGGLDCSVGGLRERCLVGFRARDLDGAGRKCAVVIVENDGNGSGNGRGGADGAVDKGKEEGENSTKKSIEKKDGGGDDDDDGSSFFPPYVPHRIPGFAIGGLAGGESKSAFYDVVDLCCKCLPDDRPRYLMGVGYPLDLVLCTALGVDMYDCVYPTRIGRFGVALVDGPYPGTVRLKSAECGASHDVPIMVGCACPACRVGFSRARLHGMLKAGTALAAQLVTQHNLAYMMNLSRRMRGAIMDGRYGEFVKEFVRDQYPGKDGGAVGKGGEDPPDWVLEAMALAGIDPP